MTTIRTSPAPAPIGAAPAHRCAADGCSSPTAARYKLWIHLGDNPPDGRPTINVVAGEGVEFCSAECRAAWWSAPTAAALLADPAWVASPHPITATAVHDDHDNRHLWVYVEDRAGNLVAAQSGVPAGQWRFADGAHLEAWWRGEAEAWDEPDAASAAASVTSAGGAG